MESNDWPANVPADAVFRGERSHGDTTYRFFQLPSGNPPGQVKAYACEDHEYGGCRRRRVLFDELPTTAMKQFFVMLTGKSAAEIGVTIR